MRNPAKVGPADRGPWGVLRALRRRLAIQQHHPIYVERESKEHPLLEDLIGRDPPAGGLAAFIRDLDRS